MWFFQALSDFELSRQNLSCSNISLVLPFFFFLILSLLLFQRITTSLLIGKLLAAATVVSAVLSLLGLFSSFDLNQFGSSIANHYRLLFISKEQDGYSRDAADNQFVTNKIDSIII